MTHMSGDTDNHKAGDLLIPSNNWGNITSVETGVVEERFLEIKNKIAPCKPRIIGVTKYFGVDAIVNGYKAGLRNFGESRANDAVAKIELLPTEVRKNSEFHFIGHLQTNKAEKVVQNFDYIQSVDSLKLAKVISQIACRLNKREKILLQVNVSGEEQKYGFEPEDLIREMAELIQLGGIEVKGLMCMAPFGADEKELRSIFGKLRELRDAMSEKFGIELPELSMGMSDDYHIAVEEGATMIRIGRKLFK